MLKELLKQLPNGPLTPSKIILDQIIKGCVVTLHSVALLPQDNANPHAASEKHRNAHGQNGR
jgi:hypothetical protein